jgi:hypothetical protein
MLKVNVALYLSGSRVLIEGPVSPVVVFELVFAVLEFAGAFAFAFALLLAFESGIGLHAAIKATTSKHVKTKLVDGQEFLILCIGSLCKATRFAPLEVEQIGRGFTKRAYHRLASRWGEGRSLSLTYRPWRQCGEFSPLS